jgi:methionyl-tRNA synthetase
VIYVVNEIILSSDLAVVPEKIAIFFAVLMIIMIWSAIWKAIAMWKSGRNNQVAWFVVLCIFNTIGILEILYLAFWQKDKNPKPAVKAVEAKPVKKAVKRK